MSGLILDPISGKPVARQTPRELPLQVRAGLARAGLHRFLGLDQPEMAFDAHKNFAYSTVATAPSPATSGTSLVVASGDGAKFPTAPFNATIWPASSQPTTANAEIVRVTAVSTDTLTITRAQESTSARTVGTGDQIAATITAKTITDIETSGAMNFWQNTATSVSVTTTAEISLVNTTATTKAGVGYLVLGWVEFTKDTGTTSRAETVKLYRGTSAGTLIATSAGDSGAVASMPFGASFAHVDSPGANASQQYTMTATNFASATVTATNCRIMVIELQGPTGAVGPPGTAGAPALQVRGPFTFHYNTPSLNSGVAIGYTPAVGDLIAPFIVVTTAFNGTTPFANVGVTGDSSGFWSLSSDFNGQQLDNVNSMTSLTLPPTTSLAGAELAIPQFALVTAADPLLVWASQTGAKGDTAVGGSAGTADVYVITATPSPF